MLAQKKLGGYVVVKEPLSAGQFYSDERGASRTRAFMTSERRRRKPQSGLPELCSQTASSSSGNTSKNSRSEQQKPRSFCERGFYQFFPRCFTFFCSVVSPFRRSGCRATFKGCTQLPLGAKLRTDSLSFEDVFETFPSWNCSTSSFRYPCLVTTYSLSPNLPWSATSASFGHSRLP